MPAYLMPDAGEGLTEAEIVEWHVAVGDEVGVNDDLLAIETAKSVVELPSPFAGTVTRILVEEGETVDVGAPIVVIDDGSGSDGDDGQDPARRAGNAEGHAPEASASEPSAAESPAPAGPGADGALGAGSAHRAPRTIWEMRLSRRRTSTPRPSLILMWPARVHSSISALWSR